MAESSGEGLAVMYDTTASGYSPIASGNTNLISTSANIKFGRTASLQILTDGGAKVDWSLQATDLPNYPVNASAPRFYFGQPARDNSFGSAQWSTIQTGILATGGQQSVLIFLPSVCYLDLRLLFVWDTGNTGGATGNIFAVIRNMGQG